MLDLESIMTVTPKGELKSKVVVRTASRNRDTEQKEEQNEQ